MKQSVRGVKGHPEIAGQGIEYLWGLSKKFYRKQNDLVSKNLHDNVQRSLLAITPENQWASDRRCREHLRAYLEIAEQISNGFVSENSIEVIESVRKHMKAQRTHRNVMEIEHIFIAEMERVLV